MGGLGRGDSPDIRDVVESVKRKVELINSSVRCPTAVVI